MEIRNCPECAAETVFAGLALWAFSSAVVVAMAWLGLFPSQIYLAPPPPPTFEEWQKTHAAIRTEKDKG